MGGHEANSGHLDVGGFPHGSWGCVCGVQGQAGTPMILALSIQKIKAQEIPDSHGNPTVEGDLFMAKGTEGPGGMPGLGGSWWCAGTWRGLRVVVKHIRSVGDLEGSRAGGDSPQDRAGFWGHIVNF